MEGVLPGTSALAIFTRVVEREGQMSSELARAVMQLHFPQGDIDRMNLLGEKSQEGSLTPQESEELGNYVLVGQVLAIFQSKARKRLKKQE